MIITDMIIVLAGFESGNNSFCATKLIKTLYFIRHSNSDITNVTIIFNFRLKNKERKQFKQNHLATIV